MHSKDINWDHIVTAIGPFTQETRLTLEEMYQIFAERFRRENAVNRLEDYKKVPGLSPIVDRLYPEPEQK